MLRQLLFLVLTRVVAGTQVSGISFSVLDSNSTAAAPGEVPASLSIGFTATSTGTSLATINLPSGFLSDGNMNIGGGRRLEEDDSDFGGSAAQRRLAAVCEAYGTATVSSNVLTVPVRKVGTASTPCDTAGVAISMVLTANTASFSSLGTGQLDFTVQTDVDNTPVSVTFTVDNSGSFTLSAIGDPITWYQGQKYKFWFPPGELMPLLETPEMTVWASVFQGPSIDFQWFDRFMVTGKDGGEYVDIRVRRHVPGMNRTDFRHNQFTQLDIKMSGRPIRRRGSQLFSAGDQVKVGVGSRTVNPPRLHHTPVLEFVMVESDSISFMVHASHAGAEFPDDFDKQVKNTHLDWINLEMVDPKKNGFKGILPQIWRVQPRTPEVEAMLIAPSKKEMAVCTAME